MKQRVKAWGIFKDHQKRGAVLYGCFLGKRRYQLVPGWYWKRISIEYDDGKKRKAAKRGG